MLLLGVGVVALIALATLPGSLPARGLHAIGIQPGLRHRWLHAAALLLGIAPAAPALATAAPAVPVAVPSGPVPPTAMGINLVTPDWFSGQRVFANLAIGDNWRYEPVGKSWGDVPAGILGEGGTIVHPPAAGQMVRMMTLADTGPSGRNYRCTFAGTAKLWMDGGARASLAGSGQYDFNWKNQWNEMPVTMAFSAFDPAKPLHDLDCREKGASRAGRFDPAFVRSLAGYSVLRFKDWQRIDLNPTPRWATRHTPGMLDIAKDDGVPIEDMLALARETGADPWFSMAWNADDEYIRNFARMTHDGLSPHAHVYVETANEVWNWGFVVTGTALSEGKAEHLSADANEALLFRYAERTMEVMKIWEQVFADRPGQLVRVVSTQNGNPYATGIVFRFPGLATHVDALATAPYFGDEMKLDPADASLNKFFHDLDGAITMMIDRAAAQKAIAQKYGKRYIAYEAGQSIMLPDLAGQRRVQRDPRMYDAYKRYIAGWRARIGDLMTQFTSAGAISKYGAFGLVEHDGQPLSDTPKLKAVLEARQETAAAH